MFPLLPTAISLVPAWFQMKKKKKEEAPKVAEKKDAAALAPKQITPPPVAPAAPITPPAKEQGLAERFPPEPFSEDQLLRQAEAKKMGFRQGEPAKRVGIGERLQAEPMKVGIGEVLRAPEYEELKARVGVVDMSIGEVWRNTKEAIKLFWTATKKTPYSLARMAGERRQVAIGEPHPAVKLLDEMTAKREGVSVGEAAQKRESRLPEWQKNIQSRIDDLDRDISSSLEEWGEEGVEKYEMKEAEIAAEITMPKLAAAASGVSSVLSSLAVFAVTKSPAASIALLTAVESQDVYNDARDAGKSPEEAMNIFLVSAAGTALLEGVGFKNLIAKGSGRKFFANLIQKTLFEGGQELTQNFWQNSVAKHGYDSTRGYFDGWLESLIGGLAGGGFGGAITLTLDGKTRQKVTKDIRVKMGVSAKEANSFIDEIIAAADVAVGSMSTIKIGEQRPVGLRGIEGEPEGVPRKPEEPEGVFGEKRMPKFFPEADMARSIQTETTIKKDVEIKEGKTYRAGELIESNIFKENPELRNAEIVVKKSNIPAQYDIFGDKKIYISPTSGKHTLESYLDHELQHKHDVETLGLFKDITEKTVEDITLPHEKRAYITTFRSALERGYDVDVLRRSAENLSRDHPQGERAATAALEYLDEAVKQVEEARGKPTTAPAEKAIAPLEAREVAPEEIAATEKRVEAIEAKKAAEEKMLKPVEAGEVPTMAQKEMFPDTTRGQADIFTEGAKVEEVPMPEGFEDIATYEKRVLAEVAAEAGVNPFSKLAEGVAAEMNKSGAKEIDGMDQPSMVKFLEKTGRAPKLLESIKKLEREVQQLQTETGQDISMDEVFSEAMDMFRVRGTAVPKAPTGKAKIRAQMKAAREEAAPKTTAEKIKALPLDKRSKAEKKIDEYERAIKQAQKTGVFPERAREKLEILPKVKIPVGKAVERVAMEEAGVKVPAKKVEITEKAALKERIAALKRGATFAERATKKEIASVQTELTKIIKDSPLDPKDKAKFLPTIKNIRTREQLDRWLPEVEARIGEMFEASSKRKLIKKIKDAVAKTAAKGKKPKGKYTPEVQRTLDSIKKIVDLNQKQATKKIEDNLEKYAVKMPSEIAAENYILSLYTGTSAQKQQLLDIINQLIEQGSLASALKKFNIQTDIQMKSDLVVERITGGKGIEQGRLRGEPADKTKIQKVKQFLKGVGKRTILDWRGLMTTLDFNSSVKVKPLADFFSVSKNESKYKELQSGYRNALDAAISSIYGVENKPNSILKVVNKMSTEKNKVDKYEMTRDELIKRYMEIKDPTLTDSFMEGNGYTDKTFQDIESKISEQDKKFAEWQLDYYQKNYSPINEVYSKMNGVDLPKGESYSPIRRVGYAVEPGHNEFMDEAFYRKAVTNKSLITRVKNLNPILKQGSLSVLDRYATDTNYYIAWAEKIRELDSVFSKNEVREAVKQEFPNSLLNAVENKIQHISTHGNRTATRIEWVDYFRRSYVVGNLAVKPALAVKQLVSTLAYTEKIGVVDLSAGILDFMKSPIENYKTLQNESAFIKMRGAGMERDIRDAIKEGVFDRYGKSQNLANTLLINIKLGDKGAIVLGSWAMRKARLKAGVPLQDAISEYEEFSADTQQSADISRLSEIQLGGSIEKLFTVFKSSQRAYFQKELNAVKSLFRKDGFTKENIKKVGKTLWIYHILLPVVFQWIANMGGWDEDDIKDYKRAAILGSFNGLFIAGDVIDGIIRQVMGMRVWDTEIIIADIGDDINKVISNLTEEDISTDDVQTALDAFASAATGVTGLPIEYSYDILESLYNENYEIAMKQALGWSEYVIGAPKKKKKKKKKATGKGKYSGL